MVIYWEDPPLIPPCGGLVRNQTYKLKHLMQTTDDVRVRSIHNRLHMKHSIWLKIKHTEIEKECS